MSLFRSTPPSHPPAPPPPLRYLSSTHWPYLNLHNFHLVKGRWHCLERIPKRHTRPGESTPQEEESQRQGGQTNGRKRASNSGCRLAGSQGVRPGLRPRVAHPAVQEATAPRGQEDEEGEESPAGPREGSLPVDLSPHGALAPQACREVWRHVRLVQRGDGWRHEWGRRRIAKTSGKAWPFRKARRERRLVWVWGYGLFGEGRWLLLERHFS